MNASASKLLLLFLLAFQIISCSRSNRDTGNDLTILLWEKPISSNPNRDFDSLTDAVLFNAFEPLVSLDAELHLEPALAVSWENPRPEVWRFHLRSGVRFHDGSPMTCDSVRSALQLVKGSNWETAGLLSLVTEIRCAGPQVLDLIAETPYAVLSKLSFVHIFKMKGEEFVGTGPFRIKQWNSSGPIVLQRNENYWKENVVFSTVQFVPVLNASERVERIASGQADLAYFVPPGLARIERKDVRFLYHAGLAVYYLGFNLKNSPDNPFQDLRIRKAIHLAVNRPRIIKEALLGKGHVPTQSVSPLVFGFNPEIPAPDYDVKTAKQLLSDAGFPGGFAARLDFGESRAAVAEMIREDLQQIGIQIQLDFRSRTDVYELAESGQSEFFLVGWDCSSGDASEFYEFNLHTPVNGYGQGNYGRYSNPELDQICESHSLIMGDRKRKEMLQRAAIITMEELPVIPVFIEDDIYAMREGLTFEPRADGQIKVIDLIRK